MNNGQRTIDRALALVKLYLQRAEQNPKARDHWIARAQQFKLAYVAGGANWSPVKRNKGNGRKHAIRHARNLRLSASRFRHGVCR